MADNASQGSSGSGGSGSSGPEPEATRYDAEYLVTNARSLLKSTPPIVAGALAGGGTKTFTIDGAKKLVKDYEKRPVEHAGEEE